MNNNGIIHEYIYDKRRQLKGVWVAAPTLSEPNEVGIGWALCNNKLGDKFDKRRGISIALGRASKLSTAFLPSSLQEGYNFFFNRCKRYYKDKTIVPCYSDAPSGNCS